MSKGGPTRRLQLPAMPKPWNYGTPWSTPSVRSPEAATQHASRRHPPG